MSPSLAVVELPGSGEAATAHGAELLLLVPPGAEPDPTDPLASIRAAEQPGQLLG